MGRVVKRPCRASALSRGDQQVQTTDSNPLRIAHWAQILAVLLARRLTLNQLLILFVP